MQVPNEDDPGFREPTDAPIADDGQFDQTIGEDGGTRENEADATIVDQTIVPGASEQSFGSETADSDATIADESLDSNPTPDVSADAPDQTLMDSSLAGDDQSVGADGRTIPLADAGGSAPASGSDATLMDEPVQGGAAASSARDDAATLMDESLSEPTGEDVDRTMADVDLARPDRIDESFDGTIVEPDGAEPDATLLDDSTGAASGNGEADGTVLETEVRSRGASQGSEFGQTAASAGSRPGNWNATQSDDDAKKKNAHETAERWENEQRYQLVNNFARGGLGQIWLASDTRLRREVAYKEMLPAALKNRNALERFLEEAQITGQLEHPGIVPIYDIGYQGNGTPFYSMKLVRGDTMEKAIERLHDLPAGSPERSLAFRKLLGNFVAVCNAMAFAHERGVLHRDLKPLNIMLGSFGEALVLDWGLAKVLDINTAETQEASVSLSTDFSIGGETVMESSDGAGAGQSATAQAHADPSRSSSASEGSVGTGESMQTSETGISFQGKRSVVTDVRSVGSQTMMGSVMGTPSYMPPEQATGKVDELDNRSDIYSLGGILYKLLTNHQPIPRGRVAEVIKKVIKGDIVPPREHDPDIPQPLEAICLKSMAKDRDDRYESALDLAADVEAFLADEDVSCFEDPWKVRFRRWARRHPKLVSGVATSVAVLFVVGTLAIGMRSYNLNQIRSYAATQMRLAEDAVSQGDYKQAQSLLTEARGRTGDDAALSDLHSSLSSRIDLIDSQRLQQLRTQIEAQLVRVDAQIENGEYPDARTQLAELTTLLSGEAGLPDLRTAVFVALETVEQAIELSTAIADTADRFTRFLDEANESRAYGSLKELDDIDDDAKLAIAHIESALELFSLNTESPFATAPPHFSDELVWTRKYFEQNAVWPLDRLKNTSFELLLLRAEMETQLARNESTEQQQAAAERALKWIARAETIGLKSKSLLAWKAIWLELAGQDNSEVLLQAKRTDASTALDFYMLAESDRKRGLFDRALDRYLQAQQRDPQNYWIQHFTGLCYLNQGQARAALATFTNCVSLRPGFAWPHMLRGLCHGHLGNTDAALTDFAQAARLDPDSSGVFINRGAVLLARKDYAGAAADFQTAAKLSPQSAKPLINLALTHYSRAIAINSDTSEDGPFAELNPLQRQALELKELQVAHEALDQASATARAPNHPGIHQLRGQIYDKEGKAVPALSSLARHVELETNPIRAAASYKLMGHIHFETGSQEGFKLAQDAFYKANELQPDAPETTGMMAETHLRLRELQKAREVFDKYFDLIGDEFRKHVKSPSVLFTGMATTLDRMGKKREALVYYTLSTLFEAQVVPLTKRAWILLQHGVTLAIEDFRDAKKLGPKNPDTLIGLAFAWTQAGLLPKSELRRLISDEYPDVPDPLAEAVLEIESAEKLASAQAEALVRDGNVFQAAALHHNTATVYAQCLRLLDEGDERQKLHAANAVRCLIAGLNISRRDLRVSRAMVNNMLTDPALSPLYTKPVYRNLLMQLDLPLPVTAPAPNASDGPTP